MDSIIPQKPQHPSERVIELTAGDLNSPELGTVWDLCLSFEYDLERLVGGLAEWLGPPDGLEILDAACGSGVPALDLQRLGYQMTCTDASPLMLERFSRNAQMAGVTIEPRQAYWEELHVLYPEQFDVVLCRGSSLIYAGTWDSDSDPDRSALECSVKGLVGCLRPGGRLYVDTTREEDLHDHDSEWETHPSRMIDGHYIRLRERVTADKKVGVRRWEVELQIDDASFAFDRKSHHVPHTEFTSLLEDAGLEGVARVNVDGERYAVFAGRKPLHR